MTASDAQSGNALDRALALTFHEQHEPALRLSLALLQDALRSPGALFVTGCALAGAGDADTARSAFELATQGAIVAGNLPLAVVSCLQYEASGGSPGGLERIAKVFEKGSPHLADKVVPPELAPPMPDGDGLSATGKALLKRAQEIVELAQAASESLADSDRVAPQVLFSALEAGGLQALLAAMEVVFVDQGETLIEEGSGGSEAYVLARGELEVLRAAKADGEAPMALARLGRGAVLGEMSLLSRAPRAASVIASRPSVLLRIDKGALDQVATAHPDVAKVLAAFTRQRMVDNLVRTSPVLAAVKSTKRGALFEQLQLRTYEKGERLIEQGQPAAGLFLIASGGLKILHRDDNDEGMLLYRAGPGDVVGEVALVLRRRSNADVVAEHATVALYLTADQFLPIVRDYPAMLVELYELAVRRDEETSALASQEAAEASEFVE